MYCQKCGKELEDGAKVCDNCGYSWEDENKRRRIFKVVLIFLGVFVLTGLAVIGYFIIQNQSKEVKSSSTADEEQISVEESEKNVLDEMSSEVDETKSTDENTPRKDVIVDEPGETKEIEEVDKMEEIDYVFDPCDLNDTHGLIAVREEDTGGLLQEYLYGTWQGTGEDLQYYDNFVVDENTIGGVEYTLYSVYEDGALGGIIVLYKHNDSDDIYMLKAGGTYLFDESTYRNMCKSDLFIDYECDSLWFEKNAGNDDYEESYYAEDHFEEVYRYTCGCFMDAINSNLSITDQIAVAAGVRTTYQDVDTVDYDYYSDEYGNAIYSFTFQVTFDEYGIGLNVSRYNMSATVIEYSDGTMVIDDLHQGY